VVDHRSDRPLYQQVADDLRAQIAAGLLEPGHSLPTADGLGRSYGVGVDAARDALSLLRDEGLVETRRGHPARVRGQVDLITVSAQRGSRVRGRMPTPAEVAEYDMPRGVPMLVVVDPAGRVGPAYPAHLYEVTVR
jgi:DNA-binding transcriptional regulator YhcF (GntR family)